MIWALAMPVGGNIAIDEEAGNSGVGRPPDRRDRRIGSGVVEDDRHGIGRDGGVDQVVLPVGIVVVRIHAHAIAEARAAGRSVAFGFEERIVLRGHDDGDERLA